MEPRSNLSPSPGPAAERQLHSAASDYIVVRGDEVVEQIAAVGADAAHSIQVRRDGVLYCKVGLSRYG